MKTILLTGGLGYIGSHICVELLNSNYSVVVVDKLINSNISIVEDIKTITGKDIIFYNADINDKIRLDNIFSGHKIDYVIHLAALKSVPESVNEPLKYYYNNVTGTLTLLSIMKKYGVNNIIFSSSAAVYKPCDYSLNEECELGPINPYGNTKWINEQILKDVGMDTVVLRYFNPIGNHSSGLLFNKYGSNVMPKIGEALINNATFNICGNDYNTNDGTCIRDYVHVVDIAKGHLAALRAPSGYHVYNLGTGVGTSVLQLVNKMGVNYKIVNRREGDAAISLCDPTKIYKELGWKTTLTLDDMCKDTLTGIKRNKY